MRTKTIFLSLIILGMRAAVAHAQQDTTGFSFVEKSDKKQIDVMYNGSLVTAYCYYDSVMKPILYPVKTIGGITITRGFPIATRKEDDKDHPHQVGIWLNHENVNGLDFWNNSPAIPASRRPSMGIIQHDRVISKDAGANRATLEVSAQWRQADGRALIAEVTRFDFNVVDSNFFIDRSTTLIGLADDVVFKDAKDAFLGMRVAAELELPEGHTVGASGKPGEAINNPLASGTYRNSEGTTGEAVWGKRAKWLTLGGTKDGKQVSVTIIDHPSNVGYPSYWHARGYGLFAINPLGDAVFTDGAERKDFVLKGKGGQVTFKYRIVIHQGDPVPNATIERWARDFR